MCSDAGPQRVYRGRMNGYGQFCPVAKTAELLCERWAPLILRELMCGSSRFGEIQRGVPLISPSLLSKRLHQLVSAGVVEHHGAGRDSTYTLTASGWELHPVIEAMGIWGQRWARSRYTPDELDPSFLMWDIRRMLRPAGLADRRIVIELWIRDGPPRRTTYWMVVDDAIDLCLVDPGLDVDLRVNSDLRTLTRIWMGDAVMRDEIGDGRVELWGPPELTERFPAWLGCHPILGGVREAETSVRGDDGPRGPG